MFIIVHELSFVSCNRTYFTWNVKQLCNLFFTTFPLWASLNGVVIRHPPKPGNIFHNQLESLLGYRCFCEALGWVTVLSVSTSKNINFEWYMPVRKWFRTVSIRMGLMHGKVSADRVTDHKEDLLAKGSERSFIAILIIQRTSVIASTIASLLALVFKVIKRDSRAERKTGFMANLCESCVAKRSIFRSKSDAFCMALMFMMAMRRMI